MMATEPGAGPFQAGLASPRYAAVGAGRMGRGIAIAFAYAGHRIALVDLRPRDAAAWQRLRDEAGDEIRASLQALVQLGAIEAGQVEPIARRVLLVPAGEAPATQAGRARPRAAG